MMQAPAPGKPDPTARSTDWLSCWPGIAWPPVPSLSGARYLSVLQQLRESQWWTPETLLARQMDHLQHLFRYAFRHSAFYRERLARAGIRRDTSLTLEALQGVEILTRRDLQEQTVECDRLPPGHGQRHYTQSSGSTGEPVRISASELTGFFWSVFTLREHAWHHRDFSLRLASIRAPTEALEPKEKDSWGGPVSALYRTGRAGSLSLNVDVSRQVDWLVKFDPGYLLTYASNLQSIMDNCAARGLRIAGLRQVRSISETVSDDLRRRCQEEWGVPLVDVYSAQEAGYIAMQCPDKDGYHVQSENVLVEILDDADNPCAPGETGRIVVTCLHNFATPLIRYELRDLGIAGEPCPCGRGLPVIRRILGRERNMLTMPSGEKRWPLTGYRQYETIAPEVRQFQFIQRSIGQIEVRLVLARPMSAETEARLRTHIQGVLRHPFEITFVVMDQIPRSRNGKFEEFISAL